jgi:DsbC/DsbD-like thiol-disulfide interchange protein
MKHKIFALMMMLLPSGAFSQTEGLLHAEILQGGTSAAGQPLAALSLQLAPGWKTYWRAPGEGGLPPVFEWQGSDNLAGVEFFWPRPQVFESAGFVNIGYFDTLVLPFAISPTDAGTPVMLRAQVAMGICKDICIPVQIALQADVSGQMPNHPAIAAALADQPISAAAAGMGDALCSAQPISDGMRLTARIPLPAQAAAAPSITPALPPETVVIEHTAPATWVSAAVTQRSGEWLVSLVDLVPPQAKPFDLRGEDLRMTVLMHGAAVDIQGCALN